jgi:poly(3-hydroxyalkanoate) synthetase
LWSKKTPEELIEEYIEAKENNDLEAWERDITNTISEYYNALLKEGYTINYANTCGSSVRGLILDVSRF